MQYISNQLFRDASARTSYAQGINPLSQRFRIEAHHFITAICGYIFHVSIAGNWHVFQTELNRIQTSLSTRTPVPGISQLCELHAKTLERITFACFLKTRQLPILRLLEGTFETILLFAKTERMAARREQRVWARMREEMEDNTRILYGMFVKRAGMFVRVVDGLERRGVVQGEMGDGNESGWFADLLVRLDGSYYDR
jgi:Gamma tubulin complex component C-terminal